MSWPKQGSQHFLEKPKFEKKSWISWDWGRACQGKLGGCPPPKCFSAVELGRGVFGFCHALRPPAPLWGLIPGYGDTYSSLC